MIEIVSGKQSLSLATPVIGATGIFGFAGEYGKLIDLSKLGAIVTNPVTLRPRRVAQGTRVVALDSGILIHTGLPNPGVHKVHREYATRWKTSPTNIIIHVIAHSPEEMMEAVSVLDRYDGIAGLEIGLSDDLTQREVRAMVNAARNASQLPILALLPQPTANFMASAAVDGGADALVVSAPPRGSARDPLTGTLVGGRIYAPWVKTLSLRAVGQIAARFKVPIIGSGGVFNPQDAREFIAAGAIAVQVDAVAWVRPTMVEIIARDLGGLELTRPMGAMADEWYPGFGETAAQRAVLLPSPPPIDAPPQLPK